MYDPNLNITCPHPIGIHDGKLTLGTMEVCFPQPAVVDSRSRRRWVLPYVVQRYLEEQGGHTASAKEDNERNCALVGPGFARRWNFAHVLCFERPLVAIIGKTHFRRMAMRFPQGGHVVFKWQWLWEHRALLSRLKADNGLKFMPLLSTPTIRLRQLDQPLQYLRELFGKGLWKRLNAQSDRRIYLIAEAVRRHNVAMSVVELVEQLVRLPSAMFAQEHAGSLCINNAIELELIGNLAAQRPFPVGDLPRYRRLVHMWGYIRDARGDTATPLTWSARRIEDEHARHMQEAARKRRLEEEAAYLPFVIPEGVPLGLSTARRTAILLQSKAEYEAQGSDQRHCVGAYAARAQRGQCFTYSITDDRRKVLSTAMYNREGDLEQHYGPCNSIIRDPGTLELVNTLQQVLHDRRRNRTSAE